MKVITITNQKGGVGKTTTAHVLSCGLAGRGFRVCAVDLDPQTNFTYTAGIMPGAAQPTLYELFKGSATSSLQAVKPTEAGFSIIPGSLDLAGADMEFTQTGREFILKGILQPLKDNFDYCIIDTPPTLGILTVNALTASDRVIIPMCADIYSLQGLSQLQGLIQNVRRYSNPDLIVSGLLLTRYNPRAVINRQLRDSMWQIARNLDTMLFASAIREAVAVKEVQFLQGNIFKDYPKANITRDYNSFINEFLEGDAK